MAEGAWVFEIEEDSPMTIVQALRGSRHVLFPAEDVETVSRFNKGDEYRHFDGEFDLNAVQVLAAVPARSGYCPSVDVQLLKNPLRISISTRVIGWTYDPSKADYMMPGHMPGPRVVRLASTLDDIRAFKAFVMEIYRCLRASYHGLPEEPGEPRLVLG